MTQIQNFSTIREIRKALGASISEGFAQVADNRVIPVINVNPKDYRECTVIKTQSATASGAVTVLTSSSTRDTYITQVSMSVCKNASCDVANGQFLISVVVGGNTYYIAGIALLTLTAQDQSLAINLDKPVKIDRNTAVTIVSNTYTVGAMVRSANVIGYEVDVFENA